MSAHEAEKLHEPTAGPVPPCTFKQTKLAAIRSALDTHDHARLTDLSLTPGGLLTDALRREAWPLFLHVPATPLPRADWHHLPAHADEPQVALDVNRSFIYYPSLPPRALAARKRELSDLIVSTLRRRPSLCYFQGFHDICQVLLLVLGAELAGPCVEALALVRIRDFMLKNMQPALAHLRLLLPLLRAVDGELAGHIGGMQPFFALAATLTLYAHEVQDYADIARLFDVFLASEPVFPVYLFAAVVLARREEVLDIPADEPEILHSVLSKLPRPLDLEGLIQRAVWLRREVRPETLQGWEKIGRWSVLKTGDVGFEEAERCLKWQGRQLEWERRKKVAAETAYKHRRSLVFGVSVFVAVAGVLLAGRMGKTGGGAVESLAGALAGLRGSRVLRGFEEQVLVRLRW